MSLDELALDGFKYIGNGSEYTVVHTGLLHAMRYVEWLTGNKQFYFYLKNAF